MNSQIVEEHKKHVYKFFKNSEVRFTLKEPKCDLFMGKIKYLG